MRRWRPLLIGGVAAVVVLAGQAVVRTAPAHAEAVFPGTWLTTVSYDEAQPMTYAADQGDRRNESAHYMVTMQAFDRSTDCLHADDRTLDGRNGGIVELNACIHTGIRIPFWQWGWQFEPTSVTGLYRIHMGDKCLDADNTFGVRNGDRAQLWDCLGPGWTNQYWWLVNDGSRRSNDDPAPRTIVIKNDANGKCLDIDADTNFGPDSPALVWDCIFHPQGGIMGQAFTPVATSEPGKDLCTDPFPCVFIPPFI